MKPGKMMALVAVAGLVASSASAAVRPTVPTLGAGARVGAVKSGRSHIAQSAVLPLALVGAAAVGVGAAAAAGAFDHKHHNVSP